MNTYENLYFGVSIEFPENWTFQIRGNANDWPQASNRAQGAYDHVPFDDSLEKELFYSFKRAEGSPSILSCSAGMAVFYREKEFDFASERIFTDFELKREAGITAVSGIAARYLYLELQFPKYICRRNFIYWQARPKLWLNFAIEGNTLESYAESVQLFSRLNIENP